MVRFLTPFIFVAVLFAVQPQSFANSTLSQTLSTCVSQLTLGSNEMLKVVIALGAGVPLEAFGNEVQNKILALSGSKNRDELMRPSTLSKLRISIRQSMTREEHQESVGQVACEARKSLTEPNHSAAVEDDTVDFLRGYGWKLLPEYDQAFLDPVYLASHLASAGQSGDVMDVISKEGYLAGRFEIWVNRAAELPFDQFSNPSFYLTGSDANSVVFKIAQWVDGRKRARLEPKKSEGYSVATFNGTWGGSRGASQSLSCLLRRFDLDPETTVRDGRVVDFFPSPVKVVWNPTDQSPLVNNLRQLEARTLKALEAAITRTKNPVRAVFLESILGAAGVYFFRTEFLKEIRKLCDRYDIPIIADEILTGGGRTGKFFAFQNYAGFEPDYVTFGKGLQVAGVARFLRSSARNKDRLNFPDARRIEDAATTLSTEKSEALLKSVAIIRRIHEGKLIQNAATVGEYFRQRLLDHYEAHFEKSRYSDEAAFYVRGKGLLMHTTQSLPVMRKFGRMMPHLALSKVDVEGIMRNEFDDNYVIPKGVNVLDWIVKNFLQSKIQDEQQ